MKKLTSLLLLSAALPAFSFAQVLVNDTFSDGGRSNGADTHDAAWFYGANNPPASVGVVDVGGDNRLRMTTSGSSNPLWTATFAPTTLAVGQTISLSFQFTSTAVASANGVRFGLYNGGGTDFTADIASNNTPPAFGSTFHDDVGFSVFAPQQQTGTIQLYNRKANSVTNANLLAGAATINEAVVGASGALGSATNTTTLYDASLALTLTASGYDYTVSYAGTSFGGSTTLTPTTTFDTIGILFLAANLEVVTIDNVNVAAIPEPSAFAALAGLAALGALAVRRRR